MGKKKLLKIADLPTDALDAAASFHAHWLPQVRERLADAEVLTLVFPPAPATHRGWQIAAVQDLAREAAPVRINGLVGDDEEDVDAVIATLAWLERAPGITGQLLAVDGKFAESG